MIKLRMDVDYPYPSRFHSFVFTALNTKAGKGYLKNSKIIAEMINESPKHVEAYWFFTPQTLPDKEMLDLLHNDKHEVCLHVANDPYRELEQLEKATKLKARYYTVHGTARIFARLLWRRKIWEARAPIPAGFPLKNFWDFPTLGLDRLVYSNSTAQVLKVVEKNISQGNVLHVHPEWLFQRGKLNHRGPYYETLKTVLQSDRELEGLVFRKRGFAKLATYAGIGAFATKEYEDDFEPSKPFLEKLVDRGADIYTFLERKWCCTVSEPRKNWVKAEDNIALYKVTSYKEWWESISKKTRNMVRKAEKNGVTTVVANADEKLAEGVWKIYNETPIRQGRAFPHFEMSVGQVRGILLQRNCTFIGAYINEELVGFVQLVHGKNVTIISQILSMQKYWDKAINNALVAKAIEVCSLNQIHWVMYGRMGNHPSLDNFKESNNFTKFSLTRYYVPLTRKGKITVALKLHRELKDTLPEWVKKLLYPGFSWVSRTKMSMRLKLHR